MFADRDEHLPEIGDAFSIEVKFLNGGAAGGGETDKYGSIGAPLKMVCPFLYSRMEKRREDVAAQRKNWKLIPENRIFTNFFSRKPVSTIVNGN